MWVSLNLTFTRKKVFSHEKNSWTSTRSKHSRKNWTAEVPFLLGEAIFSKIWTEIAREKRTTASFFSTPKPSEICWQNLKNVVPSTGKLQKTGPKSHKSAFLMPSSWKVRFFISFSLYTLFESSFHPDYKYLSLICWIDLYVEKSPAD